MTYPYFYALRARWFGWDRLFKIFVTRESLCAAKVATQIYNEGTAHMQLVGPALIFGPLVALWVPRLLKRREKAEAIYAGIDPRSPQFLAQDKLNFRIAFPQIERIVFDMKVDPWRPESAGNMNIYMRGQKKKMQFRMIDNNPEQVAALLKPLDIDVQVQQRARLFRFGAK